MTEATVARLRKAALDGVAKFAVKLNTATPYYWCTGYEAVTIGGNAFQPKGMKLPDLNMGSGELTADLTVEDIVNPDGSPYMCLAHHNFTERFSGKQLTWYFGTVENGAWNAIYTITWYVESCRWRTGQFQFNLTGTTGKYPRSGLPLFNRRCNLIYKGTLCSTGPSTNFGSYATCSGTLADCQLRHGVTVGPGVYVPFRGLLLAPEAGDTIKLNESVTLTFAQRASGDKPNGHFTHNPWSYLQVYHPQAQMIQLADFFVSAAMSGPSDAPSATGAGEFSGGPPGPPVANIPGGTL